MSEKTQDKDKKVSKNITIRPSVIKTAINKAKLAAKKAGVKKVNFSQFIEIAINDYNAEY